MQLLLPRYADYVQREFYAIIDACMIIDNYDWQEFCTHLGVFAYRVLPYVGYAINTYYDDDKKEVITFMPKNTENSKRAKWKGFININLTPDDKPELAKFRKANKDALDVPLGDLLRDDVSISLKWDSKSECFMAAMRCDNPSSPNGGYCITSRSRDFVEAYWMSLYKHFVICEGDWSQHSDSDDGFFWG